MALQQVPHKLSTQCRTATGKIIKIPPFVWKSVQKLESEKEYLETDGLYRVPGDAAKVQKIRVEVDQVRLGQSFQKDLSISSHCETHLSRTSGRHSTAALTPL